MEQEVEAVIEQGRQIPPAPDVVRARLLARARAAFAASVASPSAIPALSTGTVWRGRRIAVAGERPSGFCRGSCRRGVSCAHRERSRDLADATAGSGASRGSCFGAEHTAGAAARTCVEHQDPTASANDHAPGVVRRRAPVAAARSVGVCQPRVRQRARAARGAWTTLPEGAASRGTRGAARAIARARRARRRSAARSRVLRQSLSAQCVPASAAGRGLVHGGVRQQVLPRGSEMAFE